MTEYFVITNCTPPDSNGDISTISIQVGDATILQPNSCFGWKVEVGTPATLSGSGASYFITHNQVDTPATTDSNGNVITPAIPDVPDILVGSMHIPVGKRSDILSLTDPIDITVDTGE